MFFFIKDQVTCHSSVQVFSLREGSKVNLTDRTVDSGINLIPVSNLNLER